jgi:ATP-binding cassette, subfamily A (ABC1), member 3
MEEAEALADRVGIMEQRMLALGTVTHLRHRYGDSYTVHLVSRTAPHTPEAEMERLRRWMVENIDGALLEDKSLHGQLKFSVPTKRNQSRQPDMSERLHQRPTSQEMGVVGPEEDNEISPAFSTAAVGNRGGTVRTIFAALEANRDFLDLGYYSVSPSALEEVFFNVVGSQSSAKERPRRQWRQWFRK